MALKLKFKDSDIKDEALKENKKVLKEDTVADLGKEPVTPEGQTVDQILNECAEEAADFYSSLAEIAENGDDVAKQVTVKATNPYNPLFVGPTGSGKTSKIIAWANKHNIEVVTINMMGDALDFLGVKTIEKDHKLVIDDEGNTKQTPRVHTVATQAFDKFLTGKTKLLFLDELNKTNPKILQALYDLISFHTIQNGDEPMYLNKLLFTVGAMNPSEYGGGREQLDPALKARMSIYNVGYETEEWLEHEQQYFKAFADSAERQLKKLGNKDENSPEYQRLEKTYTKAKGRLDLINKIAEDPKKIKWTDAGTIADVDELEGVLVPRTLEAAIATCDGTLPGFLNKCKLKCGIKSQECMLSIFNNYHDKVHKANEIWGKNYDPVEETQKSPEKEIIAKLTDKEKAEGSLKTNMYDRLKQKMREN